jgi:hypothetical protein
MYVFIVIGIRAHGFNTKPGWATNVEFEVKIPQGFDVQSAKRALRELLGGIGKIRRYNGLINHMIDVVLGHKVKFRSLDLLEKKTDPPQPSDLEKVHEV